MIGFPQAIEAIERDQGIKLTAEQVQSLDWKIRSFEWFDARIPAHEKEVAMEMFSAVIKQAQREGMKEAVDLCDAISASVPDRKDVAAMAKAVRHLYRLNHLDTKNES